MKNLKIKHLFFIFIFIIGLFLISSCDNISVAKISNDNGKYTLRFDLDGGTSDTPLDPIVVEEVNSECFDFDITKDGYSFTGWSYDGQIIYDENGNLINNVEITDDMTFKATWDVNYYNLYINHGFNPNYDDHLQIEYNDSIELTIFGPLDVDGYSFEGCYIGDNKISDEKTFTFRMPSNDVYIDAHWTTKSFNLKAKDQISNSYIINANYQYKSDVYLEASEKTNYQFDGWYLNNKCVSTNYKYQISMPHNDVEYEARYTKSQSSLTIINQATNVTVNTNQYNGIHNVNETININATNNSGKLLCWYIGDKAVNTGNKYSFKMPSEDITIVLKTIVLTPSDYYVRNNDKIYFGHYPQTLESNQNIINQLNGKLTNLPNSDNLNGWVDYNYYGYGKNKISSYMYYKDIDLNEDGIFDYRGVYFTKYRANSASDAQIESTSFQDDNGYFVNNVYWFKYEIIEWNILKEEDGKAIIYSNIILDNQFYYHYYDFERTEIEHNGGVGYINNYALSDIRIWLNDNFYNDAFDGLEKKLINITEVDNSEKANRYKENGGYAMEYLCENTFDNIYLLAQNELTFEQFGYTSGLRGSDYAKCQGLEIKYDNSNVERDSYYLRTPGSGDYGYGSVETAKDEYSSLYFKGSSVYYRRGIRPVCCINL